MMHGYYGYWHPGYGFSGFPFLGLVFGIVLLVLVAYLIVLIVKKLKSNSYHYNQEDPLTILKRRYAKGEISRDEYDAIMNKLKSGS
ncbi:MAG: SHOCT domain-containing protein [Spirochaetota bacterium]